MHLGYGLCACIGANYFLNELNLHIQGINLTKKITRHLDRVDPPMTPPLT